MHKQPLQHTQTDWLGILFLIPPPLFWAGNFLIGRVMTDDLGPMTLLFGRWLIALVLFTPFAFKPIRNQLLEYWQYRWRIVAVTLTGVVGFNSFVYMGLQDTTASNALILNSLIPILIMLIGFMFYRQRLQLNQVLGVVVSFVGVSVILTQGNIDNLISLSFSKGDLVVFCAMLSWSFYTIWIQGFPSHLNRFGLIGIQMALGVIIIFPLFLWENANGLNITLNIKNAGALLYLGLFPSVLAYLCYNYGAMRLGPAKAGLSVHLIPVFGVILAIIFLNEKLYSYHLVGIVAIALGITAANYERKKNPTTQN